MENEYSFLQCEDGIYFGKPLENKTISEDSIKIKDRDIINLFLNYLIRFCIENKKDTLEIVNSNNETLIEAKLYINVLNN